MRQYRQKRCELDVRANSGGNIYGLNESCGFYLSEIDGLGIADTDRLFQKSPQQLGVTDLGFDIDARNLLCTWVAMADTNPNLWRLKETFHGIFRPRVSDDPTQLIFGFPDGTLRAADVHLQGMANFPPDGRLDGKTHRIAVVLRAEDSRLYDPRRRSLSFQVAQVAPGWEIRNPDPLASPINNLGWEIETVPPTAQDGWHIGGSFIYATQTFLYANGSLASDIEYPVIRMNGPIEQPVITNLTTVEKLDFTDEGGLIIPAGEWVEIDLRFRSGKTIKRQDGTFVDQFLTDDSNLDTFHLSYNTELVPNTSIAPAGAIDPTKKRSDGTNTILVKAEGADNLSSIEIFWYDRYIGKG